MAAQPGAFEEKTPDVYSHIPPEDHGKSAETVSPQLIWRPAYLRRRVLLAFLVLFCALFASLEALNQVSRKQHGLVSAPDSRRYLWTYGPTLVFTVVAAFWSRVEFQAKASAPWINLKTKRDTARKTVLLDYVSGTQIGSFIAAFGNGNHAVAIAITGTFLFKLLIVFSTGLLSLGAVEIKSESAHIVLRDSFTTSNPLAALQRTGTLPYNILTGVAMSNLTYPEGTGARYAFQWFSAPDHPQEAVRSATVDVFGTGLDCEEAEINTNLKLERIYSPPFPSFEGIEELPRMISDSVKGTWRAYSSSCETNSRFPIDLEITNSTEDASTYWGVFTTVFCEGSRREEDRRVLLSVGEHVRGPETPRFDPSNEEMQSTNSTINVLRSTSWMCRPTYALGRALVNIRTRGEGLAPEVTVIPSVEAALSTIDGLTTMDLHDVLLATINPFQNGTSQNFAGADSIEDYPVYSNLSVEFDKGLIIGLLMQGEYRPSIDALFNASTLIDTAALFYQGIGAQVAHYSLMSGPKNVSGVGSVTSIEDRLLVREVSLRAMEACVLLALILTIAMIVLAPRHGITARKPTTIAAAAHTAASSPSFNALLRGTGGMSLSSLQQRLGGHRYHSSVVGHGPSPEVSINVSSDGGFAPTATTAMHIKETNSTYRPLPMRWFVRIPFFLILLILIAVLEAVLQTSKKNNGLSDVTNNGYRHYAWTYLPGLVMVSVSVAFTTLDFSTRCIAPYAKMMSPAGATYRQALGVNFLDQVTPVTMVRSIQTRHWAVLTTTIATIIGSTLAIIASGLYRLESVPQTRDIQIRQDTWFTNNITSTGLDAGGQLGGISTAGIVINGNLTDPAWTYNDLAFPALSVVDSTEIDSWYTPSRNSSETLTLTATIPATRPNLTCIHYKPGKFETNLTWGIQSLASGSRFENLLTVIVPEEIYRPIPFRPQRPEALTVLMTSVQPNSYFGFGYAKTRLQTATNSNYSYMWGEIGSMSEGIKHISVLTCNETLETVDTLTTFSYPGFEIDTSRPPVPDEPTRRPSTAANPITSYDFLPNISTSNSLDPFFASVVHGKNGIPLINLGSASSAQNVITAISRTHKIIRTQQISNVTRLPITSPSAPRLPLMNTTLTNPARTRLVQDAASTRALEGLLAAMLVLAVFAALLMPSKACELPKNPCSVAATVGLWADSEVVELVREDVKALERSGWRFRVGWFERRGVGDGDGERFMVVAFHPS